MREIGRNVVQFLIDEGVLQFGKFRLKDGRISPYFLNFGLLRTGRQIGRLGRLYAEGIVKLGLDKQFDILFGPAYKGIAIAAATATALHALCGIDKGFAYNRKEAKAHGEGGLLVGIPKEGESRALIIDDVFTGGKAKQEALDLLCGVKDLNVAGILVGVDRQERNDKGQTESAAFARRAGVDVWSLVSIDALSQNLKQDPSLTSRFNPEDMEGFFSYLEGRSAVV